MVVENTKQDVTIGGAESVNAFTIKASAKAFQILSSNLYSNPLGSMVRELSTNAYDAHVMVNKKDIPFNIKLPNALEPTFRIRDFGPGLSPDEIQNVYTTFFESTKTNSNDVVGCLGLGSKSPFGVADSFTVTSFKDGIKTIYSSFLDESKIPSIAKFHEEASDEPSGIEIEVAIKEEDIKTFAREVNDQLKYFTVKPTITGDSNFEWQTNEEYIYEGANWKMVSTSRHGSTRVVQGQIAYPINTRDMGTKLNNASNIIQQLLEMNIMFTVDIGEVNIAPSREALSYDEATVDNILRHAQNIIEELPPMVSKAIQDSKNEWTARMRYQEVMSTLGGHHSPIKSYMDESGKILWNNRDVSSTQLEIPEIYMDEMRFFNRTYSGKWQKQNQNAQKNWHSKSDDRYWSLSVNDKNILFFATPDDKAVDARVKQYMNDGQYGRYTTPYIIVSSKTYRALKSKLGNPEIIKVSDLDKVRRKASSKVKGAPTEITVQYHTPGGWNKSDKWETKTFTGELTDLEGYYVELDRHDVVYQGRKLSDFENYVSSMKQLELIDKDKIIYGLRATNMKKTHKLKCLFTHVKEEFAKSTHNHKYTYGDHNRVMSKITNDRGLADKLIKKLSPESLLYTVLEAMAHNDNHKIGYSEQKLLTALDLTIPTIDLSEQSKEIDTRYAMISEMGYYLNEQMIINYINQMDRLAKLEETDVPNVVSAFIKDNTPIEETEEEA